MDEKPTLLICSPPCTYFSPLLELSKSVSKDNAEWNEKFQMNLERAKSHVRCCCSLYRLRALAGRSFLHEHPWTARLWEPDSIESVTQLPNVQKV